MKNKTTRLTAQSLKTNFVVDISEAEFQKLLVDKMLIVGAGLTKNHNMFLKLDENERCNRKPGENRMDVEESMKTYGNITTIIGIQTHAFSNSKHRDSKEYWDIFLADGQNRMKAAKKTERPFFYIILKFNDETDDTVDQIIKIVSKLNSTSKKWKPIDYAKVWAMAGKVEYQRLLAELDRSAAEMLQFSEENHLEETLRGLRITDVMLIVFGKASGLPMAKFHDGTMKITAAGWEKVETVKKVFGILPPTSYARRPFYALMKEIGIENHQILLDALNKASKDGANLANLNETTFGRELKDIYESYKNSKAAKSSRKKTLATA